jgi:nitroreductase
MDFDECLKTRRSVKTFTDKKIKDKDINEVLDSIRYAPNSGNLQNWRLILVKDQKKKEQLKKTAFNQEWIDQAPISIVVCSDDKDVEKFYGKKSSKKFCIQNCAAGIQNMLLKAHSLGISSIWNAVSDEEKIKHLLKIPEDINIHAIISFGYSIEDPDMPKRFELQNILHKEEW